MKRIYFVMMFIVCAMPLWASCSTDDTEPLPEPKPLVPSGNTKTLVAYYSATGQYPCGRNAYCGTHRSGYLSHSSEAAICGRPV